MISREVTSAVAMKAGKGSSVIRTRMNVEENIKLAGFVSTFIRAMY